MAKIFSKNQGPAVDVNRNTFDLSFASHVTGKLGDLIPVFCQEVIPGDSFEIDPKFGIRFNPLQFPIQTKMHGIMHFFYVRNRNLFDKWPEYIGRMDDDAVMPFLRVNERNAKDVIGTGSLGDYLGVPTTLTGEYAQNISLRLDTVLEAEPVEDVSSSRGAVSVSGRPTGTFAGTALSLVNRKAPSYIYLPEDMLTTSNFSRPVSVGGSLVNNWHIDSTVNTAYQNPSFAETYGYMTKSKVNHPITTDSFTLNGPLNLGTSSMSLAKGTAYIVFTMGLSTDSTLGQTQPCLILPLNLSYNGSDTVTCEYADADKAAEGIGKVNEVVGTNSVYCGIVFESGDAASADWMTAPDVLPTAASFKNVGDSVTFPVEGISVLDSTEETTVAFNPFVTHANETTPKIKLNALPFRAYESIYNYFYRDETVDPFKIDGKEVYNDFIPTHAGGADTYPYRIHQKNWERDYYTSCQVSPQQGTAPLVGISANGTFTFDDGTNQYTASMKIGDDGETITGISTYSPDMPQGSLRQLMDIVTNGISINDLRNVNSLQRWLETNIRRGYKYVDQIYSHFGVNPAFKANDMPEFLGGIHAVADINQVTDQSSEGLGQYAGQMSMFGGSDNKIHQYCDEHGYIIGIMSIFPEPVYSQMLPKHFLKTETPLDFFFPEFGHIGMQPVTYNEVTPLEVASYDNASGTDTINDVFGYQRAWADYLANTDQVHGDFRTSLSEFVVSRVFNSKPELGHDFIAIDDNDINDVFIVTDDSDRMLGELRFDVKAKRPIPMYGIPRIE